MYVTTQNLMKDMHIYSIAQKTRKLNEVTIIEYIKTHDSESRGQEEAQQRDH